MESPGDAPSHTIDTGDATETLKTPAFIITESNSAKVRERSSTSEVDRKTVDNEASAQLSSTTLGVSDVVWPGVLDREFDTGPKVPVSDDEVAKTVPVAVVRVSVVDHAVDALADFDVDFVPLRVTESADLLGVVVTQALLLNSRERLRSSVSE